MFLFGGGGVKTVKDLNLSGCLEKRKLKGKHAQQYLNKTLACVNDFYYL